MIHIKLFDKETKEFLRHNQTTEDIFAVYNNETVFTFGDMQHTLLFSGLFDMNNKEICQADIVKMGDVLFRVVFRKGCFLLIDDDKNVSGKLLCKHNLECLIVGNMVENFDMWRKR